MKVKREFDKHRRALMCPCGKSNKDGKFSNFIDSVEEGYCYKCSELFVQNTKKAGVPRVERLVDDFYNTMRAEVVHQSLNAPTKSILFEFLCQLFNEETAVRLEKTYHLGTSHYWPRSTVFWQIDCDQVVRGGKIIQYRIKPNQLFSVGINCSRVKENIPPVYWVHSLMRLKDYKLKQCFFGEHLLKSSNKTVCLVESEKTAVIAAGYRPNYLWLATGGAGGLDERKMLVFSNKKVIIWPDLGMFDRWRTFTKELQGRIPGCTLSVCDLLERTATEEERAAGLDLADFLVRERWRPPGNR